MIRKTILTFLVPAVFGIIVTDPPPLETDYKYSYDIEDPSTGDRKSQHEVRQGDVVTGAYSVVGPDGTKRIVEYTADAKHGYKAVLREEPITEEYQPPAIQQYLQPTSVPPHYYNTIVKDPVRYTLRAEPIPYAKMNQGVIFFTPANEIDSDEAKFDHVKYFEPAMK